jgi:hypothetical protein
MGVFAPTSPAAVAADGALRGGAAVVPSRPHGTLREGVTLGLVLATSTWAWLATVDALAGRPLHAFTALGGIALFTAAHYALNVVYGIVIVSALRAAEHEPSVVLGVVFGCLILGVAFAMATALLSNVGLGPLAWVEVFGGHLVGSVVAIAILARTHPLLQQVREAEQET